MAEKIFWHPIPTSIQVPSTGRDELYRSRRGAFNEPWDVAIILNCDEGKIPAELILKEAVMQKNQVCEANWFAWIPGAKEGGAFLKGPFFLWSAFSAGFRLRRTKRTPRRKPLAALFTGKTAHLCIGNLRWCLWFCESRGWALVRIITSSDVFGWWRQLAWTWLFRLWAFRSTAKKLTRFAIYIRGQCKMPYIPTFKCGKNNKLEARPCLLPVSFIQYYRFMAYFSFQMSP